MALKLIITELGKENLRLTRITGHTSNSKTTLSKKLQFIYKLTHISLAEKC
jgi:hypothetical protein